MTKCELLEALAGVADDVIVLTSEYGSEWTAPRIAQEFARVRHDGCVIEVEADADSLGWDMAAGGTIVSCVVIR